MRVLGSYLDRDYRSLWVAYGSRVALEISSAWTEGYSDRIDETKFYVFVRSGCYKFHIMNNNQEYLSKEMADELVKSLASNNCVVLDDFDMALYEAMDATPDEFYVTNALDEDYNVIPLKVRAD